MYIRQVSAAFYSQPAILMRQRPKIADFRTDRKSFEFVTIDYQGSSIQKTMS